MLGLSLSIIFVIMPTMTLCCCQFAKKLHLYCCCCKQHIVGKFLDAFQGICEVVQVTYLQSHGNTSARPDHICDVECLILSRNLLLSWRQNINFYAISCPSFFHCFGNHVKLLLQTLKVRHKGMLVMDKLTFSCFKAWNWLSGWVSNDEELSLLTADLPTQTIKLVCDQYL